MASREDCLRALQEAADVLGESPTKAAYEQLDITPSASTILRYCASWNAAKEAAGLNTNTSTGSRIEPKPDDVSLPDGLSWDSLSQDQRWHYRHREENARRSRQRRQRLKKWLRGYKRQMDGCARCGESATACLDFHHVDATRKRLNVNEMVASGYSRDTIRAEIEGCQLLCANCHCREHTDEPAVLSRIDLDTGDEDAFSALKTALLDGPPASVTKEDWVRGWTYAYQRSRGCQQCGERTPVCLQFHHSGADKAMAVGAMISGSRPVEDVLAEIQKTTVLCANCHRRKHHPDSTPRPGRSDKV